jgi:hypothetical protein
LVDGPPLVRGLVASSSATEAPAKWTQMRCLTTQCTRPGFALLTPAGDRER